MAGAMLDGSTMGALRDWARGLVVLVLVGSCLDLALPENTYRGYVRMVLGLLLVLAMLGPILAITGQDAGAALAAAMATAGGPATTHPADPAAQAAQLRAAQASLTRQAVAQRLAAEVEAAARGVPGVGSARAEVQWAAPAQGSVPGPEAQADAAAIAAVRIRITAGAGGAVTPVEPVTPVNFTRRAVPVAAERAQDGEGAIPSAGTDALAAAVRQAVAGRLGVSPKLIQVSEIAAGRPAQ